MQCHKKHIALLLLLGFLFPQAANSAHYFLVPHADYKGQAYSTFLTAPGYEFHFCDYKLSSIKFLVPEAQFLETRISDISGDKTLPYRKDYILKFNYHYSLRGPPEKGCLQFLQSYRNI